MILSPTVFVYLQQRGWAGIFVFGKGITAVFFVSIISAQRFTVSFKYWVGSCSYAALCSHQSRINIKVFVFFIVLYGLILCF